MERSLSAEAGIYIAAVFLIYWAIRLSRDETSANRFGLAAFYFIVGGGIGSLAVGVPLMLLSEELAYDPLGDRMWEFISFVGAGTGGWWARIGWLENSSA